MKSGNQLHLFTIGHSNHALEHFLSLLQNGDIRAIADVRSIPYSRSFPQFNQNSLKSDLNRLGIDYIFLGRELGARPNDLSCFVDGRVSYRLLAARPEFASALDRLRREMASTRLALMCAERNPLNCHRMILICRHLRAPDLAIEHLLADGSVVTNEEAERTLYAQFNLSPTLFETESEIIEQAYERQSEHIAFAKHKTETP